MDNSPTNQLADSSTRQQTISPKLIYGVWTFRHTPKCSGKYESCTSCWV